MNWSHVLYIHNVLSLAVYGDTIFTGTNSNVGVYRSTNNGANWYPTSLDSFSILSLAISGNIIFAGTLNHGLYKSTDNGRTWHQTSLTNQTVTALAINRNVIFAGTAYPNNGIYKSTDSGVTWIQSGLVDRQVNSIAIYGTSIFAGTPDSGVYVSRYNGANWLPSNEGFGLKPTIKAFCILNNYLFAGTQDSSVYRRPLAELEGILLIPRTGFWDTVTQSNVNLCSSITTPDTCKCVKGVGAYFHDIMRKGVNTGYVDFNTATIVDIITFNELYLNMTTSPDKKTHVEFDIDADTVNIAPHFQLKGYYVDPQDGSTIVPISLNIFSGTILSFDLPKSPSGQYSIALTGFSTNTYGSFQLYSIRIYQ